MELPTSPLSERRRERQGPFLSELEDNLQTLDEQSFLTILEKYKAKFPKKDTDKNKLYELFESFFRSLLSRGVSKNRESELRTLSTTFNDIFYETLFPLRESYSPEQFKKEIYRDKKSSITPQFKKNRINHYLNHTSFDALTEAERVDFLDKFYKQDLEKMLSQKQETQLRYLLEPSEVQAFQKSIEYPVDREKLDLLPKDVPIYFYGGHGSDLCDPNTHQPIEKIVPENCIYITTGLCGKLSQFKEGLHKLFREKSEHSRTLLRYPYLFQNLQELSKRLNVPIDDFHFHFPGETYILSDFQPLSTWDDKQVFKVALSGFCEKKDMETLPDFLQPYTSLKSISELLIKELFKTLPINTSEVLGKLKNAKQLPYYDESYRSRLNHPSAEKYWSDIEKEKSTLTKEELETYLNKFLYSITRNDFLEYFAASTYPTKQRVKKLLFPSFKPFTKKTNTEGEELLQGDAFLNLARDLQEPSKKDITTEELMNQYPGIHFFTICRSVDESCQDAATLRRTMSGEQQQARQDTLVERVPTQAFQRNLISLTFEKPLQTFIDTHIHIITSISEEEKKKLFKKVVNIYSEGSVLIEANALKSLYNLLFPMNDSYTVEEAIHELRKDSTFLKGLDSYAKLMYIQNTRANHYMTHIDTTNIDTMSNIEKSTLYNQLLQYKTHISPGNFEKIKKVLSISHSNQTLGGTRKIRKYKSTKKSTKKTRKH